MKKVTVMVDALIGGASMLKCEEKDICNILEIGVNEPTKKELLTKKLCMILSGYEHYATNVYLYDLVKPEWYNVAYTATQDTILVTFTLDDEIGEFVDYLRTETSLWSAMDTIYKFMFQTLGTIPFLQAYGTIDPKEFASHLHEALTTRGKTKYQKYINRYSVRVSYSLMKVYEKIMELDDMLKKLYIERLEEFLQEE